MNNITTRHKKTYILVCTGLVVLIFFGYWLKSQFGINLFEKYTLSKYFPFFLFSPNPVINDPKIGILFNDSFDSFTIFDDWTPLWMQEKGSVQKKYSQNGTKNSRCLVIRNSSMKDWAFSYRKYFQVKGGDIFKFNLSAKLNGIGVAAYTGIKLFDSKKQAVPSDQNYTMEIKNVDTWNKLTKTYIVPDGVKYIRFRISGSGKGEFHFDDITLIKCK